MLGKGEREKRAWKKKGDRMIEEGTNEGRRDDIRREEMI